MVFIIDWCQRRSVSTWETELCKKYHNSVGLFSPLCVWAHVVCTMVPVALPICVEYLQKPHTCLSLYWHALYEPHNTCHLGHVLYSANRIEPWWYIYKLHAVECAHVKQVPLSEVALYTLERCPLCCICRDFSSYTKLYGITMNNESLITIRYSI